VSPGEWLKEAFESRVDAELEWATPDNEVNYYVERASSGVSIDADLYVGLTTEDLVRVDETLDDDLFVERGEVEGFDDVREGLLFDPFDRAVPFDTGYVSLVYDGTAIEAPETFEGLLDDEHAGALIAQSRRLDDGAVVPAPHGPPVRRRAGRVGGGRRRRPRLRLPRLLGGATGQRRACARLVGRRLRRWSGEAPMVVSYSTDQVFASMEGQTWRNTKFGS